jgi:plasmid stability protein
MSTLVIKNLPEALHVALKELARRHHRSLNKETISLIEASVKSDRQHAVLPPPLELKGGYRPAIDEIEAAIVDYQSLGISDNLMRAIEARAARSNRALRDVVAELLEKGMRAPANGSPPEAYDLSDAEKRDLIRLIQQGKPLPEKYRFILYRGQARSRTRLERQDPRRLHCHPAVSNAGV